ncbi:hypothetical protein ABH924_004495 [Arthrobacter sp. GAS37]
MRRPAGFSEAEAQAWGIPLRRAWGVRWSARLQNAKMKEPLICVSAAQGFFSVGLLPGQNGPNGHRACSSFFVTRHSFRWVNGGRIAPPGGACRRIPASTFRPVRIFRKGVSTVMPPTSSDPMKRNAAGASAGDQPRRRRRHCGHPHHRRHRCVRGLREAGIASRPHMFAIPDARSRARSRHCVMGLRPTLDSRAKDGHDGLYRNAGNTEMALTNRSDCDRLARGTSYQSHIG